MYRQVGIFSLDNIRSILKTVIFSLIWSFFATGGRRRKLTWDIVWIGSEKLGLWLFELVSIISRRFSRHYGALFAALTEIRTENIFQKNHFFDDVLEFFSKTKIFENAKVYLNFIS